MMARRDVIGIAPTGTGKTIAFGIPMLEYIQHNEQRVQEVVHSTHPRAGKYKCAGADVAGTLYPQIRIASLYGG